MWPTISRASFFLALLIVSAEPRAQQLAQDHPGQYSQAEIDAGSRLYATQCAQCHGATGDTISGVDLRRGVFRRATTDDDLARVITNGVPGVGMPPFKFEPAELTAVVAYIRAGFDTSASVKVGSAARGRVVFEGAGGCGACHQVNGQGSRKAPDLSDIGLARTPAAIQRSLVDPSSAMLPINRPVRIVTKAGQTIAGRRLNEDTYTIQVIDERERLLSIEKSQIQTISFEPKSPMPSYAGKLTADDIGDLVAYLLTLRDQ